MQTNPEMSWPELKSKFYHNLKTFENSIKNAHSSSIEMDKIFSQIMDKSRDSPAETMEDFAKSWLKKVNIEKNPSLSSLRDDYEKLMGKKNPSKTDFHEFELSLLQTLHLESIKRLDAHNFVMHAFYETWNEKWPD